jgi:hypothetical protein
MRLNRFDLTYCSNIHPGERWEDVSRTLRDALPKVRARLGADGPFAIGLRLSAAAARTLDAPAAIDEFRVFLQEGDYYVPTINGFPYGAFHGTRVKERVYLPDWRSRDRVDYSNQLARILVGLQQGNADRLSISTVPGAFRDEVKTAADVEAMTDNMLAHAAYLKQLREQTGVTVTLAIEAEPACFIETTAEAIAFFRDQLFSVRTIARHNARAAVSLTADDVAKHLGVCLDACHMAVEFEEIVPVIHDVREAGITIAKVQLSSALRVAEGTASASPERLLRPFADDTYLHQVVVRSDAGLARFTDLPDALGALAATIDAAREWRVHFHVPIFLDSMSGFETTQSYLAGVLRALEEEEVSTCLEVETYTWDVLPPEYRTTDVCTAIARELAWVRDQVTR